MPKYLVNVYETLQHTVEVEADDRESAIEKAYDVVMNETADHSYDKESCGTTEATAFEIGGE